LTGVDGQKKKMKHEKEGGGKPNEKVKKFIKEKNQVVDRPCETVLENSKKTKRTLVSSAEKEGKERKQSRDYFGVTAGIARRNAGER